MHPCASGIKTIKTLQDPLGHITTERDDNWTPALPEDVTWGMPEQTRAKHELLRHYLNAWFPIMARGGFRKVMYMDGFAGPGVYATGEPGSPILALKALVGRKDFSTLSTTTFLFVFNEQEAGRYASLQSELTAFKATVTPWPDNVRIFAASGGFSEMAQELIDDIYGTNAKLVPTFAFIDPFGVTGVSLSQIGKLLSSPSCEIFLYFSFNEVQRFAQAGNIDHHLSELFGTDEFTRCPKAGSPGRKRFLLELFVSQMKSVGGFSYVVPFEMRHGDGNVGSYLVYGTRSLKGLEAMKNAMWKVDPSGEFRFSARATSGQEVLFGSTDVELLQDLLSTQFSGQTVTMKAVNEYVLAETPFKLGHVKRLTLRPLEQAGKITAVTGRTTKGSFPDDCSVTFA